jgi:hypothetical protein
MRKFVAPVSLDGIETVGRQNNKAGAATVLKLDKTGAGVISADADRLAELSDFLQRQQLFDHRAISIRVIVSFGWECDLHGRLLSAA